MLERSYGLPCDLWSVGVVGFMLLCGSPPFFGDTPQQIYTRVRRGLQGFSGPEWAVRSNEAKDLVLRLLRHDPAVRLTAADALERPWIVHEGEVPAAYSPLVISESSGRSERVLGTHRPCESLQRASDASRTFPGSSERAS